MALYDTLPVYKASYDLMLMVFEFCRHFRKEYKYTLGEKLKNETLEMIMNIYRANSKADKSQLLQNARENIEVVRLLFRLTKDLKLIPLNKFISINEKIENISKQLTGWQRSAR
jgi:four helix bundle protein